MTTATQTTTFTEEDTELAERYAAALERIEELEGGNWTEEDVRLAERYAAALEVIAEKETEAE